MSFLPPRKSTLEPPPSFPAPAPRSPVSNEQPQQQQEHQKEQKEQKSCHNERGKKAKPAIFKMMGSTPWFETSCNDLNANVDISANDARLEQNNQSQKITEGSHTYRPAESADDQWSVQSIDSAAEEKISPSITDSDVSRESQSISHSLPSPRNDAREEKCSPSEDPKSSPCHGAGPVSTAQKATQTDTIDSSEELERLRAEVESLRFEKSIWEAKLERARVRKSSPKRSSPSETSASQQHLAETRHRPFVSTLGDASNTNFNAMLLGLRPDISQARPKS